VGGDERLGQGHADQPQLDALERDLHPHLPVDRRPRSAGRCCPVSPVSPPSSRLGRPRRVTPAGPPGVAGPAGVDSLVTPCRRP
jgi:hypothetical protein